jgi:hypothetical protein
MMFPLKVDFPELDKQNGAEGVLHYYYHKDEKCSLSTFLI